MKSRICIKREIGTALSSRCPLLSHRPLDGIATPRSAVRTLSQAVLEPLPPLALLAWGGPCRRGDHFSWVLGAAGFNTVFISQILSFCHVLDTGDSVVKRKTWLLSS